MTISEIARSAVDHLIQCGEIDPSTKVVRVHIGLSAIADYHITVILNNNLKPIEIDLDLPKTQDQPKH